MNDRRDFQETLSYMEVAQLYNIKEYSTIFWISTDYLPPNAPRPTSPHESAARMRPKPFAADCCSH